MPIGEIGRGSRDYELNNLFLVKVVAEILEIICRTQKDGHINAMTFVPVVILRAISPQIGWRSRLTSSTP